MKLMVKTKTFKIKLTINHSVGDIKNTCQFMSKHGGFAVGDSLVIMSWVPFSYTMRCPLKHELRLERTSLGDIISVIKMT